MGFYSLALDPEPILGRMGAKQRKPALLLIVASVRRARRGAAIGNWIYERAVAHGAFNVSLVDRRSLGLPFPTRRTTRDRAATAASTTHGPDAEAGRSRAQDAACVRGRRDIGDRRRLPVDADWFEGDQPLVDAAERMLTELGCLELVSRALRSGTR
jgi:hypothetical protein